MRWTAGSSDSWCTVSPASGDESTKSISFTFSPNETFADRRCTVTIMIGGLTKTIDIIQVGPKSILVTQNRYDLSNDASTIEVEVKDYVKFNVDISHNWIKQVAANGSTPNKIKFAIAKNESHDNRKGSITISQKDGTFSSVISIYQSQKDAIILSDKILNLSGNEQKREVELKTNVDFEIINPESVKWVHFSTTRALRSETLFLTIYKNDSGKKRTAKFYIKNKKTNLQDTLTINQNDEIDSGHPFLIVTKDMYPALRQKASKEPWKSMKTDAISYTNSTLKAENAPFDLTKYIGAAALSYILDEENAEIHANRVYNAIKDHYSKLVVDEKNNWSGIVSPLGALFVATLSLDIVYEALNNDEIAVCEDIISTKINLARRTGSWADARRGAHGTWDIYKGIRTTPDNDYYSGIMKQITPDGVSPVTPTYAWTRVGGGNNEVAKSAYMDVLEFTGIDKRYYNNERIIKFQRWLYGSSIDCAKNQVIFGDMVGSTSKRWPAIINWRIVNYDHEAAQYAAWLWKGQTPPGHILSYIIPKSALPEPNVPSSQIYENGGAFLRDKQDDPNGLSLMLYNIKTQADGHLHHETNALSLSALGNRLLVNGGRLGATVALAYMNNTLTINGKNHSSKMGDGILEGFISDDLDFAVGSAGEALPSASHLRNAVLVHSTAKVPGYFIIFDEVTSKVGDQVKNYLHAANETNIVTVSQLTEYTAKIDHFPTASNVSTCFYYVTPPKEVNIKKVEGANPINIPNFPDHNRFEAVYNVNEDGKKNLTTIIYPFSNTLPKATFQNIGNTDFNACAIPHDNAIDYFIEPSTINDSKQIALAGVKVVADFCLIRKIGDEIPFYLVKNGLYFSSNEIGFQSDKKITVYASGTKGKIISQGAKVKLVGVGMDKIKFTPSVKVLSSGSDFIEVQLNKGTYSFL